MSVAVYCRTSGEIAMLRNPVPALYQVVRARKFQEGYSKPEFNDVLGIENLLVEQA